MSTEHSLCDAIECRDLTLLALHDGKARLIASRECYSDEDVLAKRLEVCTLLIARIPSLQGTRPYMSKCSLCDFVTMCAGSC